MEVSGKQQQLQIQDIMLGEVWLCSGQSNMEFAMRDAFNYQAAITIGESAKAVNCDVNLAAGSLKSDFSDIYFTCADGETRIVDRKKDMILVSGFNVYPAEVEEVISQHPGVMECVAIGIPSEHSGEAVKVVVVRRNPELSEDDVRHWCRENLTGYKRPSVIEFRDELPKSNVGKVLRRVLREEGKARRNAA